MLQAANDDAPLRIGIGAPYDLSRAGGVNTHIRAQARALTRLGHDVRVFGVASAPLPRGETALSGCITFVIGGTETAFGIDPRAWLTTRRLFRQQRFDILHVHEPLMPLASWFALLEADVPVVATFHTHREHGHTLYRRFRPLLTPLMRRVSYRIAVSPAARRTTADVFPGLYDVVPNGIDAAVFQKARDRPASMPAGRRHVLFVGRLEPRKGVSCLIKAMARVQRAHAGSLLIIVGEGPERRALETLARETKTESVFAGYVPDADLPAWFQSADIVCSPATGGESFGVVLLEAMASGTPVVASRIEGYAALVGDTDCARLVPPGDDEALARAIVSLLDDDALRMTLGARGRAFAQTYDWTVIARQLEQIYRSQLTVRPANHRRG
jgi:phosphatidylinositol alpha-mannosyltransferase